MMDYLGILPKKTLSNTISLILHDEVEIWLAEGSYKETSTLNLSTSLSIYGGFLGTESLLSERDINKASIILGDNTSKGIRCFETTEDKNIKLYNIIIQNTKGAIQVDDNSTVTLDKCLLENNTEYVMRNSGGVIILKNTVLRNNVSDDMGYFCQATDVINSTFFDNVATKSVYEMFSFSNTINSTFVNNSSGDGVIASKNIKNCIVWGNKFSPNACLITGTTIYSITQDLIPGEGNNDKDPILLPMNKQTGFLPIIPVSKNSPAISAGIIDDSIPTTDIRGVKRNSPCTIGSYEFLYGIAYETWIKENNVDPLQADPTNKINGGLTNLEKFTFGLDASKATSYDANAFFKHTSDATGASLQFPVSVDAEGVVNVKALKSVDLINWVEATATATGETSADGKFKIYKVTAPVGEEGKVFLKLQVEEK